MDHTLIKINQYSYNFALTALIIDLLMFLQFQEEDEVPDDETLNQMIARNEEEFELYMVF